MRAIVSISVIPEKVYSVSIPAGAEAFYSGIKVAGEGMANVFIAIEGVNTMEIVTPTATEGTLVLTELLRSHYEPYDGLGGIFVFQQSIDGWAFRMTANPEWISMVGNRLVMFKSGMPWIQDGQTNSIFGRVFDSAIALVHSEDGNSIKTYKNIGVEGDLPDRVHIRTEVPYEQSSDIVGSEFRFNEGVYYKEIERDRLSPNATGTYNEKLFTGDPIRGEVGKFMVVFTAPSGKREIKFFNVSFDPSLGHTV